MISDKKQSIDSTYSNGTYIMNFILRLQLKFIVTYVRDVCN